jgi:hypothetical protein
MENTHDTADDSARRDLLKSVCLLALVFTAVLCGLARDENWRKLLRVAIASSTYFVSLLSITWALGKYARARGKFGRAGGTLPFWPFASAGAAAELSSGWLRTGVAPGITLWLAPLAAVLVGGVHWLALRYWRSLRAHLTRDGRVPSWRS